MGYSREEHLQPAQGELALDDTRMERPINRALFVREPWAEMLLSGEKVWEVRSTRTKIRGPIAIITSGTNSIHGIVEIVDVVGPLTLGDFNNEEHRTLHRGELSEALPYPRTCAWVMNNPMKFSTPIPFDPKVGPVIWMRLDERLSDKLTDLWRNHKSPVGSNLSLPF